MSEVINVYCDESCHLENDGQRVMVLGAIWCPRDRVRDIAIQLRDIKEKHGLPRSFEVKWTKVSEGKREFYLEIVRFFFEEAALHFRALIVPDKGQLRHEEYGQDHATWYFKMYFDMLKVILTPHDRYRIYLDVKDTCSAEKMEKLRDVLCNNMYDFSQQIIERLQGVRSHEVEILQVADLLIGAVCYANRGLMTSSAKTALVEEVRSRSGYCLTKTTLVREPKMNLFRWRAQERSE